MLLDYYGLREQPFGVTPNPRFLYLSPGHREALASLVYGIESGRGFLALIAPPGMGKTTLLFQFLEQLGNRARTVFLFQSQLGSRDFLRSLMSDLGVGADETDLVVLQSRLNQILIDELHARRKFVLVVDEAQNLDDSALEFVRMLSNFETPRDKLMHIVLAGQPQLAEKLARPSMVQLRQRISMLIRLRPLDASEVAGYVEHRVRVAGHEGPGLFTGGAYSEIAALSGGIPRNINNLCFNSLSLAYAAGRKTVDAASVREVAGDLDLSSFGTGVAVAAPAPSGPLEGSVGIESPLAEYAMGAMPTPAVFEKRPASDRAPKRVERAVVIEPKPFESSIAIEPPLPEFAMAMPTPAVLDERPASERPSRRAERTAPADREGSKARRRERDRRTAGWAVLLDRIPASAGRRAASEPDSVGQGVTGTELPHGRTRDERVH